MSLRENVDFIPVQKRVHGVRVPAERAVRSMDELDRLLELKIIEGWQYSLLWLIDIKRQSLSHIARSSGCTRQHVHQEYGRIKEKISDSAI